MFAADSVMVPAPDFVRPKAPPPTGAANVMLTGEETVVLAPRVTGSLKDCAPVVMTLPPLMSVDPAAFVVKPPRGVVAPTDPVNVVTPAVLTVRLFGPLTVALNVMALSAGLTLVLLVSVVFAPTVTGSA